MFRAPDQVLVREQDIRFLAVVSPAHALPFPPATEACGLSQTEWFSDEPALLSQMVNRTSIVRPQRPIDQSGRAFRQRPPRPQSASIRQGNLRLSGSPLSPGKLPTLNDLQGVSQTLSRVLLSSLHGPVVRCPWVMSAGNIPLHFRRESPSSLSSTRARAVRAMSHDCRHAAPRIFLTSSVVLSPSILGQIATSPPYDSTRSRPTTVSGV
jgi:hypothetical protein